jgi:Ca2+-binding EF-hand superfamily protein
MKAIILIISILISTLQLPAQTNGTVRLALISESPDALAAADVLTAELSSYAHLQLLERNEIERVYREQGLSAANKDYLKLGQVLGADGLLLLDVVRTPAATNLTARLIDVKPGVVLTDGSFSWPLANTSQWAESVSTYLDSFLPKLTLLVKDAIPISVVNLRSAVQSADGLETERQLKLLTIQRLSQERQLFVLERQKMQLLAVEKDLKLDDSAFWNGSYLLEGVVDQNGYSKDTITISARLTPPKGGAPVQFEISGSRTNFTEVINQLAAKVNEALKVGSTVPAWNAADEAAQYFDEAKWALKWGVYSEAQAAADSAWALGKHDMDCATVRVRACMALIDTGGYQKGDFTNPRDTNDVVQTLMENAGTNHIWGLILKEQNSGGTKVVQYVSAGKFPDSKNIDLAAVALQIYYDFSRTLPLDEPKADSAWYRLGIENLIAASQVLQYFQFVPESQKPAAEKLAGLRALARSVAEWISKSPSVHDSYFVGDRIVTHDELARTMEEQPNIFRCKVNWGCFWQEKPEDCVALYRELMCSPVFSYIQTDFWLRNLMQPRLVAWNQEDQKRIPAVWDNFVLELNNSTNALVRLETKAIQFADTDDENKMESSFTNLFNAIFENHDALVKNNVEVMYLNWGLDLLISAKTGSGIFSARREDLRQRFYTEYNPKLRAMDQEYRQTTSQGTTSTAFERQKQYLKDNKPFDFQEFAQMFLLGFQNYSKAQALEIQPLITAYKSNLVAQSQNASGMQKAQAMGAISQVNMLEFQISSVVNPPAPSPQPQRPQPNIPPQAPKPPVVAAVAAPAPIPAPEIVTNILTVNKFLEMPLDGLPGDRISGVSITAHHWFEGKLLLDYQYEAELQQPLPVTFSGVAIVDPASGHWDVSVLPEIDADSTSGIVKTLNYFYHRSALWHGELFNCDGGQIEKYDFQNKKWQIVAVSDGNNYELFVVNDRLYAANRSTIFELIEGGKSSRLLASTRRQPPVSKLDSEDLGLPTLVEGPSHSLRAIIRTNIYVWDENNWQKESVLDFAGQKYYDDSILLEYFDDAILFRWSRPQALWVLQKNQPKMQLGLYPKTGAGFIRNGESKPSGPPEKPLWEIPAEVSLGSLPAAMHQSDLYLLVDHSQTETVFNNYHNVIGNKFLTKDGYHAKLLCISHDLPAPQKFFLKFDAPNDTPPVASDLGSWMLFTSDLLLLGLESPRNVMWAVTGNYNDVYKPGVWLMPVSQIEPDITAQKQIYLAKQKQESAQAAAAAEQTQKSLLAKYDHNHNGVIDPAEKEEALDDPDYIESELDKIDANHNGWLDAGEVVWFDTNTNKILEPKEQAGIDIAQHLLAQRLLKQFDANGDGLLDRSEFNELWQSGNFMPNNPITRFLPVPFPDDNHDGKVDLGELETFLKQQTRTGLRSSGMRGPALFNQISTNPGQPVDPRQMFKAAVESYWQNPVVVTNRPSFNRAPSVGGAVTNGAQSGKP